MVGNNSNIRQALKAQNIRQEDLAKKLNVSRQTVARYLTQYEKTGQVVNPNAQQEFERLKAMESYRALGTKNIRFRTDFSRTALKDIPTKEKINKDRYQRFIRDMQIRHPGAILHDCEGKSMPCRSSDSDDSWDDIETDDHKKLEDVLTPSERSRLEGIQKEISDMVNVGCEGSGIDQSCILEQIWDSTEPNGRPVIYDEEFECTIEDEMDKDDPYGFYCRSFCMCNGGTAKIYADGLVMPVFEHEIEVEVFADIRVITDQGTMYIDTVKMEKVRGTLRYVGRTDDLIPGYKYIYTLGITAGDYDDVNDQEYTLLEGYSAKESHPLK